jgi:hypothetical protein
VQYYAHVDDLGPIPYGRYPYPLAVYAAPMDIPGRHMPIGAAEPIGRTPSGLATWKLTIDDADVPGLFVIVDREFVPAR